MSVKHPYLELDGEIYVPNQNIELLLNNPPNYDDAVTVGPFEDETMKFDPEEAVSTHPFKMNLFKDGNTWKVTLEKGFVVVGDLSFEDPNIVTHIGDVAKEVDVSADDYVVIVQTIDASDGSSDYDLAAVGDQDSLIDTSSTSYYASVTRHIIGSIKEDDIDPSVLLIDNQYVTTNLVRAISTHSGVAYYRLLPI